MIDATLATTIGYDGVKVSTVEHLMAAFAGLGIDNAEVELDAPEVPIMDGSSETFHTLLKKAGVRTQDRPKKFVIIRHPVTVTDGDRQATFLPSNDFKLSYTIDFRHPEDAVLTTMDALLRGGCQAIVARIGRMGPSGRRDR